MARGHADVSALGDGNGSGARVLWILLAGLAGAVVFICLALAVFVSQGKAFRRAHPLHLSPGLVALVIIVIGIVCLMVARLVERPLDGSSDASLVATYRSRFFVWVGLGEIPFFVGVAAVAATDWFWPCLVGGVFAAVGYVRIAPTADHLARDQDRLNSTGSGRSLVDALGTMATRGRRRL